MANDWFEKEKDRAVDALHHAGQEIGNAARHGEEELEEKGRDFKDQLRK